jgi:hypothetical protein
MLGRRACGLLGSRVSPCIFASPAAPRLAAGPPRLCEQALARGISTTSQLSFGVFDNLSGNDRHAWTGVYRVAPEKAGAVGRWAVFANVSHGRRKNLIESEKVSDERGSLLGSFADLQEALKISERFRQLDVADQKVSLKHLHNDKADEYLRLGVWRASMGLSAATPLEFSPDEKSHAERESLLLDKELRLSRTANQSKTDSSTSSAATLDTSSYESDPSWTDPEFESLYAMPREELRSVATQLGVSGMVIYGSDHKLVEAILDLWDKQDTVIQLGALDAIPLERMNQRKLRRLLKLMMPSVAWGTASYPMPETNGELRRRIRNSPQWVLKFKQKKAESEEEKGEEEEEEEEEGTPKGWFSYLLRSIAAHLVF